MWSGHSCPLLLTLFDEGTNGKGTTSVVPPSSDQTTRL